MASTLSQGKAIMREKGFSEEQIDATPDEGIRWFKGHDGGEWSMR